MNEESKFKSRQKTHKKLTFQIGCKILADHKVTVVSCSLRLVNYRQIRPKRPQPLIAFLLQTNLAFLQIIKDNPLSSTEATREKNKIKFPNRLEKQTFHIKNYIQNLVLELASLQ